MADDKPVRIHQHHEKQSDAVPIWFWILFALVMYLFARYLP